MLSLSTIKKPIDLLFLVSFMTIISLPLINSLTSDNSQVQRSEKRKTAGLPAIEFNKESLSSYPERFESFFDDNFGFRKELIHLHNYIKVFVFGVSPSKKVVLGKDGWLFYNAKRDGNPVADYRKLSLFSKKELKSRVTQLVKRHDWLKKKGIKYLYVIVPNKNSIYPEYMPDNINLVGKYSFLDQFAAYIKRNTDLAFIDLRPALIAKKEIMPVYDRTGTHWNYFGAYIGTNSILDQVNTWLPEITPLKIPSDSFPKRLSPGEDLARLLDLDDVIREELILKPDMSFDCGSRKPVKTPKITVYRGKSFSLDCKNAKRRALVFRDSFSKRVVPYLSDRFGHITYIWARPNHKAFSWFVNKEKPDVVIEIHVERYLRTYP